MSNMIMQVAVDEFEWRTKHEAVACFYTARGHLPSRGRVLVLCACTWGRSLLVLAAGDLAWSWSDGLRARMASWPEPLTGSPSRRQK